MRRIAILVASLSLVWSASPALAITFTSWDFPGAIETSIEGIDGNNIVGYYSDILGEGHGFLFDGSATTTLDHPLGVNGTFATGISGNIIVGGFEDASHDQHGFLYDGSSYTTIDFPGEQQTVINGIDGTSFVGEYEDASGLHGFLFDGSTWSTIDVPGASDTTAWGIDGANIVGSPAFLYDGSTYSTATVPGATSSQPFGIDGVRLVGEYQDASGHHGFYFDGTSYIPLDFPGGFTLPWDISGDRIVGSYTDATGTHGFIAQIPEPSTLVLLGFGMAAMGFPATRRGMLLRL